MPAKFVILLLLSSWVVLTGCERIQSTLGIGKRSPDPLRVIRQDPLAVPPNLELRPPLFTGDSAVPQDVRPIPADAPETPVSRGEAAILDAVAAHAVDPQVRQLLERDEALREAEEEESGGLLGWLDIFGWFDDDDEPPAAEAGPGDDAREEDERPE